MMIVVGMHGLEFCCGTLGQCHVRARLLPR
jgi:hypothetical protein